MGESRCRVLEKHGKRGDEMTFTSAGFWFFFLAVLVAYHSLPFRAAKTMLLVASYLFYAWIDPRFCLLLLFLTASNFGAAAGMNITSGGKRNALKIASVTVSLLVLAFFKYHDFFAESFASALGLPRDTWCIKLALPVGISFYVFRGISFTMDVARGKIHLPRSFLDFALYMAFFPHLASGPIVRASDFLPQVETRSRPDDLALSKGLGLILLGLVKKLVLADRLAVPVNAYFVDASGWPGAAAAWGCMVAYTWELFLDFSGYTDIALGCGELLGFRFPQNFARPYLAADMQEFWRRWHISLSTWLRDYLYIPLGGNRKGSFRTKLNLMATMLLGGLWHGANWTFLAWGGIHGVFLVVDRALRPSGKGVPFWRRTAGLRVVAGVVTFICVGIAWVFFRATSVAEAAVIVRNLVNFQGCFASPVHAEHWLFMTVAFLFTVLEERHSLFEHIVQASVSVRVIIVVGTVLVLAFLRPSGPAVPFLYFKF